MLAAGEADPEMRSYLEGELASAEEALPPLEEELRAALLEPDPDDDRDVIVEIRAGAGGDEAALFAGDIYHMLTSYAERHGYKTRRSTLDRQRRRAASSRVTFEVRARAPTRCSSGSRACTACSACPRPRRRAASTPRR